MKKNFNPDKLVECANILYNENKLSEAMTFYEDASKIYIPNSLNYSICLINIGNVFFKQGNLDNALLKYNEALKILESIAPDSDDHANTLDNISLVYEQKKMPIDGLEYQLKALKIYQKISPNSVKFAKSLNKLGELYQKIGKPDSADECYSNALAILENKDLDDSFDRAKTFQDIGFNYKKIYKYDEALNCFERESEILKKIDPKNDYLAHSYLNIGDIHKEKGNHRLSLFYYKKAKENSTNPVISSDCKRLIAGAFEGLGRTDKAGDMYRDVFLSRLEEDRGR